MLSLDDQDYALSNDAGPHRNTTALLIDCVDDAIVLLDANLDVLYANQAAYGLAGRDANQNEPLLIDGFVHPDDLETAAAAIAEVVEHGRASVRLRLTLPSGERPVEVTLTNHLDTIGVGGIVACFRNREHEVALETSLDRQRDLTERITTALTDHLTGLPTRRPFLARLDDCLQRAATDGHDVALFFIDLDGFKAINDTLGHTAGDAMLRDTVARLLKIRDDPSHWGRIGGDEFVMYAEGCGRDQAEALADQLSGALRRAMMLSSKSFYSSATIGVTVLQPAAQSAETAVRQADIAMYEGKRRGGNRVIVFTPEMEDRVVARSELEGQLRATLTGGGPDVVFQPVVDWRTGHTVAVEALARWSSPTRGPVGPDEFVRMAERIGIVDQLDRHVLRKACDAIRDFVNPVSGGLLQLAVNMSTQNFVSDQFVEQVCEVLDEERFPPERLVLEITESISATETHVVQKRLADLRALGIRLAIDDFGTGHSSLAQLETLPVDIVKIDRSFLADVPGSSRRTRYLQTIIALADALELTIIVEGVERPEQARAIMNLGVDLGQGYLMAKPTGIRDLADQIRAAQHVVTESIVIAGRVRPLVDRR